MPLPNATTTEDNDTTSPLTTPCAAPTPANVNEFDATVADAVPSYSLFEAVNDPPILNSRCEMFAVAVGM